MFITTRKDFHFCYNFSSDHCQRHHKPAMTNPDIIHLIACPLVFWLKKKPLELIIETHHNNLWGFWNRDEWIANMVYFCDNSGYTCCPDIIINGSFFHPQRYPNLGNDITPLLIGESNTWPNIIKNIYKKFFQNL